MLEKLKRWARSIKRDVVALYFAGRDPRVPWYAKAVKAVAVAAYALSPSDLIPDFIPVLGYVDALAPIRSHHRLLLDGIGASRDGEGGA